MAAHISVGDGDKHALGELSAEAPTALFRGFPSSVFHRFRLCGSVDMSFEYFHQFSPPPPDKGTTGYSIPSVWTGGV